jgi:hypothetical protein
MTIRTFLSPQPIDEVRLFEEVAQFQISNMTKSDLTEIHNKFGIYHSTAALYQYLKNTHHEFISEMDSYSTATKTSACPIKLLLVPGMFYKEYVNFGADGALIRKIAEKFGFKVELLETISKGSVSKNKEILLKKLATDRHPNIWLVSFSKGSTEVRWGLEELMNKGFPSNIKGWVSISGLIHGTPLASEKLRSSFHKLIWYLTTKAIGINYAGTEEISHANKTLKGKVRVPQHLEVIHITGFPLPSHLQPVLVKRYNKLAVIGPNDGTSVLEDLLDLPGKIYPIWGTDHFMRTSTLSRIVYNMCSYINSKK